MAKVDWQGLATAIGQVNQLIQPSAAATQKMEMDSWKDRTMFQYGLEKLTEGQSEVEKLEKDYEDAINEAASINPELTKNLDSKFYSGNAVKLHEIVSSKKLDSIYNGIEQYNSQAQELTEAIRSIKSKQSSYDAGKNFSIPIVPNPSARTEYMRGKPITIDGKTTYQSWDEDGSGSLSPEERNLAIANITEMMIESGLDINPQAFEAGYLKQKDEETLIAEAKASEALAVNNAYKATKLTEEIKGKRLDNIKKLKELEEGAEKDAFVNSLDNEGLLDMQGLLANQISELLSGVVMEDDDGNPIFDNNGLPAYDPAKYEPVKGQIQGIQEQMKRLSQEQVKRGVLPKDAITYNVLYDGGDFSPEEYDAIISDPIKKKAVIDFYTASSGDWTPEDYELLRKYLTGELGVENQRLYTEALQDFRVGDPNTMRKLYEKVQEQE